jgi:CubicO group peptidase (beta-lactamase class C family)
MLPSLLAALALAQSSPAPESAAAAPPPPPAAVLISFDVTGAEQTRVLRGVSNRTTGRPLTADDPVRVASISKLVVALGVMRLVDQRRIDLDTDVSRYLGWRLRHPAYPDRPITLAMLLGHRAGMVDGLDYVLPLDADLEQVVRAPALWDSSRRPGSTFAYANINFPIVAAAMEGATGERFDHLMQRLVFQPLRIEGCFNWPTCPDSAIPAAVTLYRPSGEVALDDLRGVRPACPVVRARDGSCDISTYRLTRQGASFSPQGGMRISARGLARFGQLMLREGERFITRRSFRRLTAMQAVAPVAVTVGEGGEGGFFCRYALAVHQLGTRREGCRDDPFGDGRPRIGHSGDAYSLRSGLFVDMERGTGVAWFLTESPEFGATRGERSDFTLAEERLIAEAGLTASLPAAPSAR